jgi:hypothetical protein
MRFVNYKKLQEDQGNLLLAWGPSGVGKSASTIQTSPDPIVYLTAEKRKVNTTIKAINRPDLKMLVGVYEGFEDCIETVFDIKRFEGAKTVILESLTHLMAAQLSFEILDENYNDKTDAERDLIIKELTSRVKMTKEGFGSLSGNMLRLMNGLQALAMAGYDVVCTARSAERPKYNKEVGYGPALSGQQFGNVLPGYFDFICMLESPEHKEDDQLPSWDSSLETLWKYHAPLASFDKNETYLAKWTGPYPPKGVIKRRYNVKKIFEEANGVFR